MSYNRKKYSPEQKSKTASSLRKLLKGLMHNQCFVCGYNFCLRALEFHHLDPNKKKFNISMNVLRYKFATLVKECCKSILVCNRCHIEIEEGLRFIDEADVPPEYYNKLKDSLKTQYGKRFKSDPNRNKNKTNPNRYPRTRKERDNRKLNSKNKRKNYKRKDNK